MINQLSTLLLSALSVAAVAADHTTPSHPNILFILCDDLGYGDLGCFGQTHFTTPSLDQMAKQGARLTQHYAGAPVCAPSRACLLLGLTTGHVPVRDHQFDREIPSTNTMATVLRYAGYRTMAIGKWGLGGTVEAGFPAHPEKRGFNAWYGLYRHEDGHVHYPDAKHPFFDGYTDVTDQVKDCYSTDLYTAKAKQWIADQAQNHPAQPFFMYLAYIAPHEAFDIPDSPYPPGAGLIGGLQFPLVTHPEMKNKWIYPEFEHATYRDDNDPKASEKPWTWQMQHYATMIKRIDQAVGDLVQTLRDLKIDKNTLIVFTSDNGPAYDDGLHPTQFISWGPLDGFKRDLFEGGFREPTLVWWPGTVKSGAVIKKPSAQYDWLPTFAQLAGVVPPAESDGNSLAKALTGRGTSPDHNFFYFEFHGASNRIEDHQVLQRHGYVPAGGKTGDPWGQQQAVRIGDYVGVRAQIKDNSATLRLYNVDQDPHEDNDLAGQPKFTSLIAQMSEAMLTARLPQPGNPRPYDDAPLPAIMVKGLKPGLLRRDFLDPTPWAPDVRQLEAFGQSVVPQVDSTPHVDKPLAIEFVGYIDVPKSGMYEFSIEGGATAHLWLHDAHVLDSENDAANPRRKNSILLAAGLHPIRILVTFEGPIDVPNLNQAPVKFRWSRPGDPSPSQVPTRVFFRKA